MVAMLMHAMGTRLCNSRPLRQTPKYKARRP